MIRRTFLVLAIASIFGLLRSRLVRAIDSAEPRTSWQVYTEDQINEILAEFEQNTQKFLISIESRRSDPNYSSVYGKVQVSKAKLEQYLRRPK